MAQLQPERWFSTVGQVAQNSPQYSKEDSTISGTFSFVIYQDIIIYGLYNPLRGTFCGLDFLLALYYRAIKRDASIPAMTTVMHLRILCCQGSTCYCNLRYFYDTIPINHFCISFCGIGRHFLNFNGIKYFMIFLSILYNRNI